MKLIPSAAGQLGIRVSLEPIYRVYSRYRFSWFDVFAGALFLGPVLIGFVLLVRLVGPFEAKSAIDR